MPQLKVEYAKSGRAKCANPACKKLIAAGELRIGTATMMPGSTDPSYKWRHICCFSKRQLQSTHSVDGIEGFDDLLEAHQVIMNRMIKGEFAGNLSLMGKFKHPDIVAKEAAKAKKGGGKKAGQKHDRNDNFFGGLDDDDDGDDDGDDDSGTDDYDEMRGGLITSPNNNNNGNKKTANSNKKNAQQLQRLKEQNKKLIEALIMSGAAVPPELLAAAHGEEYNDDDDDEQLPVAAAAAAVDDDPFITGGISPNKKGKGNKNKTPASSPAKKPPCPFGIACFKVDKLHQAQYDHSALEGRNQQQQQQDAAAATTTSNSNNAAPVVVVKKINPDEDDDPFALPKAPAVIPNNTTTSKAVAAAKRQTPKLPPCPFGVNCFKTNTEHFAQYSHPNDVDVDPALLEAVPPAPQHLQKKKAPAAGGKKGKKQAGNLVQPQLNFGVAIPQPAAIRESDQQPAAAAAVNPLHDIKIEGGIAEDGRVKCKYGALCFRQDPAHRAKFAH